jgi:hypothetical protein
MPLYPLHGRAWQNLSLSAFASESPFAWLAHFTMPFAFVSWEAPAA